MMRSCLLACLVSPLFSLSAAPVAGRWEDLPRVPIPADLPPHPRLFCTVADLARIRADYGRRDPYTVACWERIAHDAEMALDEGAPTVEGRPSRAQLSRAALLGQAHALTEDARFATAARELLLAVSRAAMRLERTRAAGLLGTSTLEEGPLAVDFAMAYDLVASHPAFTADDHRLVRGALRRVGWEAGHGCHHRDSSNWRSWAICVEAVCGFASGDRELIEEAINGAWDEKRNCYLYGVVQQLTHSVFSDGIHWERCMGYTYYTGSALMHAMEAARNSGIDLWHADLPGILGPFAGGAPHEEYGPPGRRSFRAFLDAPFYYAFPGGGFARIGDSGTRAMQYHPMYELAWQEYRDPKYAWLIRRDRDERGADTPAFWQIWRPAGDPQWELRTDGAPEGAAAVRMATGKEGRIALVQNVACPRNRPLIVSGRVKALAMAGGRAHIRCNAGKSAWFSPAVQADGDWRTVQVEVPAEVGEGNRHVRLHAFLESGAGEVLWTDLRARVGGTGPNLVRNGQFAQGRVDGRRLDFWNLVNGAAAVPEGEYDLEKDAAIGLAGRHANGSTLFPVGGFAILRARPDDPESLAVNLSYGPYGSGHDHPDRLTITVHGLGRILCPDAGSWGYENPMHLTWANQTVAHNTVSVDEVAQDPQGLSRSIWAAERGEQRVFGVLRLFHAGKHFQAVRATCDTAYPGVRLDRTVCLVGPYLLDVCRADADRERTFDLPLHGRGELAADGAAALPANPFSGLGYAHLGDIRKLPPTETVRACFAEEGRRLDVLQSLPPASEVFLARDPARGEATSCLLARVRGTSACFVTLLAPHRGETPVGDLAVRRRPGEIWVEATHAAGTDRLVFPDAPDGVLRLERLDAQGRIVARESARPE